MRKRFVLSDNSENSYGYHVITEGIDLTRFKQNPVMFYNHDRFNMPIGRWENIKVENNRLVAEAVFDKKDELGKVVADKVANGFLHATSIGFKALAVEIRDEGVEPNKALVKKMYITKSELVEASIVDIPANKNAIKLDLSEIQDESVLHYLAQIQDFKNQNNNSQKSKKNTMSFLTGKTFGFVLNALGLNGIAKADEENALLTTDNLKKLNETIGDLQAKLTDKENLVAELKTERDNLLTERASDKAKLASQEAELASEKAKIASLNEQIENYKTEINRLGALPADKHTPQAKSHKGFASLSEELQAQLDAMPHNQKADELTKLFGTWAS